MDPETNNNNDSVPEMVNNTSHNGDARHFDRTSIASSDSNATPLRSKISTLLRPRSSRSSRRTSDTSALESVSASSRAVVPVRNIDPSLIQKTQPKGWHTIVNIVLVEAKGLPDPPDDRSSHNLYCKFRLGSESHKSKGVPNTAQPEWRERFDLHLYKDHLLKLSLWDKGKQKNFMGSSVLDLAELEKERTHEIWQELDDGFGTVHFSITLCKVRNNVNTFNGQLAEGVVKAKNAINTLKSDWKLVGQLYVKVTGAKGLSGKPNAYCTLEVDNERVQTHSCRASSEPTWDKSYVFNVYDVTSTLDLRIYDSSIVAALRTDTLGRLSLPLLRISNGESRWYALKSRNMRDGAKGNCPRVQLEMTMFWNPVKATVRLFRPKEVKHIKKPPKFDVALVYSNMEFVRDTFTFLHYFNEQYKNLFEWENQELCFVTLVGWLLFWLNFSLWATPLLLLLPFFYFYITQSCNQQDRSSPRNSSSGDESPEPNEHEKTEKGLTSKISGLPEMTLTITGGVEYSVSLAERLYNLTSFKVPFLSFLTMMFLMMSAFAFYFIPVNYMMMAFGLFKYSRRYINPEWRQNNDLLDFLSRVPDNEILKNWKELNVPEPSVKRQATYKRRVSDSSS
ncbi:multiple C2 and transmembrane domain-containing protein-like [Ostrinia nubilalis]|uniref:multiple C2 and transmembrane domain-containing protein-like n=1 Tax=Ostrinia nubilalis TaxID=29057 RepID=UPI003082222C